MLWEANNAAKSTGKTSNPKDRGRGKFEGVHRKLLRAEKEEIRGSHTVQRLNGTKSHLEEHPSAATKSGWWVAKPTPELTRREERKKAPDWGWWTVREGGCWHIEGLRGDKRKAQMSAEWKSHPHGRLLWSQTESDNKTGNGQQHARPFCAHHTQRKNRLQLVRDILCE